MALFGKKAKNNAETPLPDAPANSPSAADSSSTGADPFATDVFASEDAQRIPAPRPPKVGKSRALKNGSIVGLNIGNTFIKAVEVTAKNGELSITGTAVMPTPPESYVNGNILSVAALGNALKTLWKQAGFKSKNAVVSVAGSGSLVVRVIEVPKMTDNELADNMRVDADRYIPFPPSEVIMDFKALRDLPSDPDAPNMEVLLAAAQREIIDLHVKAIQSAKLNPKAIDVEPLATARALKSVTGDYPDYDDVTALINIGATGTEISVLRGDLVVFTRTLPNGGNSITNAISEAFGLNFADAERTKIDRADALPPEGFHEGASFSDDTFGDFGGSDSSFVDDVFGSPSNDTPAPSGAASASDNSDPFDLDFFNTGPKQNEPGAGHSQKEGEKNADSPFNFSFDDDPATMPSTTPGAAPTPASPAPLTPPSFEDAPAEVLPEKEGVAPSASAPAPASNSIQFDFDENLPADSNAAGQAAPSAQPLQDDAVNFSFDSNLPAQSGAASGASGDAMPAMPSAFDFSDFDLPTLDSTAASETSAGTEIQSAPSATSAAPAVPVPPPAAPTSFGFADVNFEAPTVPEPQPVSANPQAPPATDPFATAFSDAAPEEKSAPPATTPIAALAPAAPSLSKGNDAGGFDLDNLFGASAASGSAPQSGSDQDLPTMESSSSLGGISLDKTGGFDIGSGFENPLVGEEMGNFGVGLADPVMADADEAQLYAAISPVLEDLAAEIRRSLEFHLGRYPDAVFSKVLLVGGGANLKNLDRFLGERLGADVELTHPFSTIAVAPGVNATADSICATALGLALREFVD